MNSKLRNAEMRKKEVSVYNLIGLTVNIMIKEKPESQGDVQKEKFLIFSTTDFFQSLVPLLIPRSHLV